MTEPEPEPELTVPRPGSVLWHVLSYLLKHHDEERPPELTRQDVSTKFDCALGGVDTLLQKPTARGCLVKSRNSKNQMVWKLGLVKRFRLDPLPSDAPAAPAEPYRAIKVAAAPAKWTANQRPTGPAPFPGEATARTTPTPAAQRLTAIKVVDLQKPEKPEPDTAKAEVQAPQRHSAAVFRLPASTTFNAKQALNASIDDELDDVLVAGYTKTGEFCVRSSRMTCAEAAFLANKMLAWALSGGESA